MSCIHNTGGCPLDVLENCEHRALCEAQENKRLKRKIDPDKLVKVAAWVTLILAIMVFSYLAYLGYLQYQYQQILDSTPVW